MLAVLVIGLLAGLIAMHHLSAGVSGAHRTAMSAGDAESGQVSALDSDGSMPGDGMPGAPLRGDHTATGLLHLCLAILTGVAIILAALVQWRWAVSPTARPSLRPPRPVPTPRAPPPSAPARLALLCVLRT